jgi:hypothetical protein
MMARGISAFKHPCLLIKNDTKIVVCGTALGTTARLGHGTPPDVIICFSLEKTSIIS